MRRQLDIDPVATVGDLMNDDDDNEYSKDRADAKKRRDEEKRASDSKRKLNMLIAITFAILATFMGICKVKDDNICRTMQQSQANKIDSWNFSGAKYTPRDSRCHGGANRIPS